MRLKNSLTIVCACLLVFWLHSDYAAFADSVIGTEDSLQVVVQESIAESDLAEPHTDGYGWSFYYILGMLTLVVAMVIFISGLDDLFIDIYYWVRRFYRFLLYRNVYQPPTLDQLIAKQEQSIAIMVPAWREDDVIADMLETNIKLIQYSSYVFFVGVYQNDPATTSEVDRVVARYPHVKKVIVPNDGPTCKADCLNWIIQSVFLHEKHTGREFSMLVMHDSEDIIHPYELLLFNYLVPRKDLIQLPVRCMATKWSDFVRGTYIDEFSEFHTKDMVVRESLVAIVPSAGVSTCLSRRAILFLCEENVNQPFNISSLTEDYDLSYRLRDNKELQQIFVVFPISVELTDDIYQKTFHKRRQQMPIATEELFPNRVWTAIRQRTRWNIGIFFQAFSGQTWKGSIFCKYYFLRDRKGILTNIVIIPAYLLLICYVTILIGTHTFDWPVYVLDIPLWLIVANTILLSNRVFQRAYFTKYLYGKRQGILSIPRIAVSNFLNSASTLRATWIFVTHLITGKKISWDKTTHEYPSFAVLEQRHTKLAELLLAKKMINEEQMREALMEQQICHQPLGTILVNKGIIIEDELTQILSSKLGITISNSNKIDPQVAMSLMPAKMILDFEIIPFNVTGTSLLETYVSHMPKTDTAISKIRALGYAGIIPHLISDSEMNRLLNHIRRKHTGQLLYGELLVQKNVITSDQLNEAIAESRSKKMTLGTLLISKGLVTENDVIGILSEQVGYAIGNPSDAVEPAKAVQMLHPSIMLNHSVYPHSIDETTNVFFFFVTNALSGRAQFALFEAGYIELKPMIVSDGIMKMLLNELQKFLRETAKDGSKTNVTTVPSVKKLGHRILEHRLATHDQVVSLLKKQMLTGERLGYMLVAEGIIAEETLEEFLHERND